jgi:hypothetical protein
MQTLKYTLKLVFFLSYLFLVAKVYHLAKAQNEAQIDIAQQESALSQNAYADCKTEKKTLSDYLDFVLMALDDTIDRANACESTHRSTHMVPKKPHKPKVHQK